jgi:apolipoprotein D and lipocalin family protein
MQRVSLAFLIPVLALLLVGCTGKPDGVEPVRDFELDRYLGKWYEIARLDHTFERGLDNITAEYSLDGDAVKVVNRGYSVEDGEWKTAEGKAAFVDRSDVAHLKVSFFGPFYGSYIVFGLDKVNYQYAFVSGPNTSYLWLLSRSPEAAPGVLEKFKRMAGERGFDTSQLIYVHHDQAQ